MNRAILALDKMIDWNRGESILLQVHDEIVCEGRDPDALSEKMAAAMEQTITLNGYTMKFTTDAAVGKDWGEL